MTTTLFDKPIFLCVIESTHLVIYYKNKSRICNIAYINRTKPISTIEELVQHFVYDDADERLFLIVAKLYRKPFEKFLRIAQLDNKDDNYYNTVWISYILHINEIPVHKLSIKYNYTITDKDAPNVEVSLILSNDKLGDFNIEVNSFILDSTLDDKISNSANELKPNIGAMIKNKLGMDMSKEYLDKIYSFITHGVKTFKNNKYYNNSILIEHITDDISEGER